MMAKPDMCKHGPRGVPDDNRPRATSVDFYKQIKQILF